MKYFDLWLYKLFSCIPFWFIWMLYIWILVIIFPGSTLRYTSVSDSIIWFDKLHLITVIVSDQYYRYAALIYIHAAETSWAPLTSHVTTHHPSSPFIITMHHHTLQLSSSVIEKYSIVYYNIEYEWKGRTSSTMWLIIIMQIQLTHF